MRVRPAGSPLTVGALDDLDPPAPSSLLIEPELPRVHVQQSSTLQQRLLPLLVQGSAIAASLIGASGCATVAHTSVTNADAETLARATLFDEAREARELARSGKTGALVELAPGTQGAPTVITIHGINGSPHDVAPLSERAADAGSRVMTFVFDDRGTRLTESSRALASELEAWIQAHPGQTLKLEAHSMGGRVTLGALARLHEAGKLDGVPIELTLIAPPLEGYRSADLSRWAPEFILRRFDGGVPGRDMGAGSSFQKMLEGLTLPSTVRTTIYVAEHDTVANPRSAVNERIARNLGARLIRVDGADHMSVIARVASGSAQGLTDITPSP